MYGESSKKCEINCQCSGLITDSFRINSGNNATKRKQEDASMHNYKLKMNPHSLNFNKSPSPIATPSKRRVLGEIQNVSSPLYMKVSPSIERLKSTSLKSSPLKDWNTTSPLSRNSINRNSPLIDRNSLSPLTSRSPCNSFKRGSNKISRIFEERSKFRMSNKENEASFISETFVKLDMEEEARDCSFGDSFQSTKTADWSMTKLDFTDTLPTKAHEPTTKDIYVPETHTEDLDQDFETLHDLEEEFENDNFDECTKYEIISTDSPDIISRGRASTSRKVNSRNFVFGAPISDSETSTSFNRPNPNATRMLNFEDENFEFTSPAAKRPAPSNLSVKKSLKFTETPSSSLKFNETPTKVEKFSETPTKNPLRHERSDSSIGSMSSMASYPSPASSKLRIFTSESTTSMESGFISEMEEPFLEMDDQSNSPKMANFNDLLSGQIKDNIITDKDFLKRPMMQRSLSFNPESSKARLSLLSILENPAEKRSVKRTERVEEEVMNKRRKSNVASPEVERVQRPVLQRAYSENNASIMSALARSVVDPDLIGDFSQPFALPLTRGEHADLKSISCDTLADLITGRFDDTVDSFQVIDCRYPYEYEGGHIAGAVNLYTPAQVLALVRGAAGEEGAGAGPGASAAGAGAGAGAGGAGAAGAAAARRPARRILVFHCEFSRERGPKLSRFLRSSDRAKNKENYPSLDYPEVYLLHEGYRAFYREHPALCSPAGYTAMLDPKHKHLLRQHRSVSQPSSSVHHRRQRLLL